MNAMRCVAVGLFISPGFVSMVVWPVEYVCLVSSGLVSVRILVCD